MYKFRSFKTAAMGGALVLAALVSDPASAQKLTNDMTCSEAQRTFERTGRVNMRSRLGPVLPIYGGVPIADRGLISCGPFQVPTVQTVITRDRKHCPISVRCS